MIAVVCMKWGKDFSPDYVNVLFRSVRRNLSHPFRFYCFTDNPDGLAEGVIARPLPVLALPMQQIRSGCWPKIGLFQPGLIEEETALFLDLDLVINGSLDPFVELQRREGGLHIIREWNPVVWNLLPVSMRPNRGGQSSVFAWNPREQEHVHDRLVADQEECFAVCRNDQEHIMRFATSPRFWPEAWTTSFKKSCVWHYPLNLVLPVRHPKTPRIIVFYGKPRPHHLVEEGGKRWGTRYRFGTEPVRWVQDYWARGLQPDASPAE